MEKNQKTDIVNILLVEDDEFAMSLATTIIEGIESIRLFNAYNGEEALEVINSNTVDMLITDIMMPVMDGFELIEKARNIPSMEDAHIIIITALQFLEQKVKGFELGANDYITKPFDYNEFKARIGAAVRTILLRKQLKKAYKELEKATEFKRLLLGRVAHDLRTPISIIDGYLHIIKDNYGKSTKEEFDNYFNNIMNQSRFINSICRDILDYTALDMGKLTLNLSEYSIESVIREAVMLNTPQANARNINIEIKVLGEIPLIVMDSHRITGVFWNLINNAIKYSRKNSPIQIDISKRMENVEVTITDHGRGISKEDMDQIFRFFAAGNENVSTGVGSVGLGLAISKRLVQLHGGDIFVESKQGVGSTFTIVLPELGSA